MNQLRNALFSAACIAVAAPAVAGQVFTMTFDDIPKAVAGPGQPTPPDQEFGSAVLDFYNGDPVYNRDGNRPWNTTFSPNALAICSTDSPDSCFGNFPPSTGSGGSAIVNIDEDSDGFFLTLTEGFYITALSFLYTDDGEGSSPGATLIYEGGETAKIDGFRECVSSFCDWKQLTTSRRERRRTPGSSASPR